MELKICRQCMSIMNRGRWVHLESDLYKIARLFKGITNLDEITDNIRSKAKKIEIQSGKESRSANIKYMQCAKCARYGSGYYEGILQVRNVKNRDFEAAIELFSKAMQLNHREFVSKTASHKDGMDYYLSSQKLLIKIARDIRKHFGGDLKITKKLFSNIKGKEIYRITALCRLPSFGKDDIIVINNNPKVVNMVSKDYISIIDLDTHKKQKIPYTEPDSIIEERYEVQVIRKKPRPQVLHPLTYQETDIHGYTSGSTIEVVIYNDKLFALP